MKLKSFLKLMELKEPPATSWSPGLLGSIWPYFQANPVKLPLLLPIYAPMTFISLGYGVLHGALKSFKESKEFKSDKDKYDYLVALASTLTEEKFPELKSFLAKNPYASNDLAYTALFKTLGAKYNKQGLLFVLDNIIVESRQEKQLDRQQMSAEQKPDYFSKVVTDVFYMLTFNIDFMKEVMSENILQRFADSRQQPFTVKVGYYMSHIPYVIAPREAHSSAHIAVGYLQEFPATWSYTPAPIEENKINQKTIRLA